MATLSATESISLDEALEADDGVVEVTRVMPHLRFPWMALPAGPRRWAPTDLSVEVEDDGLRMVRLTYRTVGDRSVVVAGAGPDADLDWMAERLSTPLLFAHLRKANAGLSPTAIMAALDCQAEWTLEADGWRIGTWGVGSRPVRLAHRSTAEGHVMLASHGVAEEELTALVTGLVDLTDDEEAVVDLHTRHRKALAQRWWDAPRTPWVPKD